MPAFKLLLGHPCWSPAARGLGSRQGSAIVALLPAPPARCSAPAHYSPRDGGPTAVPRPPGAPAGRLAHLWAEVSLWAGRANTLGRASALRLTLAWRARAPRLAGAGPRVRRATSELAERSAAAQVPQQHVSRSAWCDGCAAHPAHARAEHTAGLRVQRTAVRHGGLVATAQASSGWHTRSPCGPALCACLGRWVRRAMDRAGMGRLLRWGAAGTCQLAPPTTGNGSQ